MSRISKVEDKLYKASTDRFEKYNENHGPDGRFESGGGGGEGAGSGQEHVSEKHDYTPRGRTMGNSGHRALEEMGFERKGDARPSTKNPAVQVTEYKHSSGANAQVREDSYHGRVSVRMKGPKEMHTRLDEHISNFEG